jgi:signal transduction histidine kinase
MHVLERERNRLNTILQNMVDGLLVTSPDGKIIMVNPVVEDLLHRSAQHLVAQPLEKFLDGEALQRAIGRSWGQPGRTEIVEFTLRGQNIRAVTTTLRDRSAVVTMLRDVTQDVEVDRMKSEFISSVSHELRTPLTSIVGFTKLIQRAFKHDLSPVLPDEAKVQETRTQIEQNLDIMLEESKRLADLVDDVLDVAALDTGEAEWHDQLYNFPALLQRVVDHMRPVASEKELQIRLRIDRGVLQLEADPDRIEQVLSNLLSNAIKFTSKGTVTVSASALDVGQRVHGWRAPEGGAIHVTVKDTGLGIPRAAQAELFQRFRQIDDSTGQKPRGSGLGLVICREIITHYGGIIWVESEMGKGSAFSFVLPVHHRTEPAPSGEGR